MVATRPPLNFGSDILAMRTRQRLRIMPDEAVSLFIFETGIRLLTIFDGEQCCIDNVMDKVVIYQRRSPSFIESDDYAHFAQILCVLPVNSF